MSQMTTDQRPPEYLRADAARNLHRIVEVAARLLGDDPHVGMAAVAEAADVSRATVYRHFPTREALMDAIRTQALAAGAQAIVECRLEEDGATEALRRLVEAWLDIAERYGFAQLVGHAGSPLDEADRAHRRRVFGAVVIAAARAVDDGALSRADAPDTVFNTLMKGFTA